MNWMTNPSPEVILLHILILSVYHLLFLFARKAMKDDKLFPDRVRIRSYLSMTYLLITSWAALVLDFVNFPGESRWHTVIKFMEFSYIPLCIYLYIEISKSYILLTEKSKKYYEASVTDSLTKLPNRILFYDRLNQLLLQAREQKTLIAVMYVDLDQFKTINDEYGHLHGDRVLNTVATRLQGSVRSIDTVSRMGGDEFTVIVPNIHRIEDAELIARRILASVSQPIQVEDYELLLSTSIGISFFPYDGNEPETLVNHADSALYMAKKVGKNNYQMFKPEP